MLLDVFDDISGDNIFSFFLKVFKMLLNWGAQLWNIINAHIFTIAGEPVYFWQLLITIGALAIIIKLLVNWLVWAP